MKHPMDYYGRIVELEAKLKKVELENERLRTALGKSGLNRLARIERDERVARTLRNETTIKPAFCTVCEKPIEQHTGGGRPRKTCSMSCAKVRQRILVNIRQKANSP